MKEKDFYELVSTVEVLKTSIEKDFLGIDASLENLKALLEKDITYFTDAHEQLKSEIWELKANAKTIHQNEVDIATLIEKATNNTALLESYKKELEAKMVTKDYLNEKKYKDWRLWLIVIGLTASLVLGSFNAYQSYKNGETDVPSSNQK